MLPVYYDSISICTSQVILSPHASCDARAKDIASIENTGKVALRSILATSTDMPSSKPKPSDVAADAKRNYIPTIRREYAHQWPTYSYIFQQPLLQIPLQPLISSVPRSPEFCECFRLIVQWLSPD